MTARLRVGCVVCGESTTVVAGSDTGRAEITVLCPGCATWHTVTVVATARLLPRRNLRDAP